MAVHLHISTVFIQKAGNVRRVWAGKMFIITILSTFSQTRRHTVKNPHTRYIKNVHILLLQEDYYCLYSFLHLKQKCVSIYIYIYIYIYIHFILSFEIKYLILKKQLTQQSVYVFDWCHNKIDEGKHLMTLYQVNTITNHKNCLKIINLSPLTLILLNHSKQHNLLVNSTKTVIW